MLLGKWGWRGPAMQCRGHNTRANCFGSTDVDAYGAVDRIVKHNIFSSLFDLCTPPAVPLPTPCPRLLSVYRELARYGSPVYLLLALQLKNICDYILLKCACIITVRTECFSHSLCCPSWGWLLPKISTLAGMVLLGKCMVS